MLNLECETFSGIFLLGIVATLHLAWRFCFQVRRFMCYLSVIFLYLPLQSFKRLLSSTGLALGLLMHIILIDNGEEILCSNIAFNAHTRTQQEIVVGDMLRRNDIIFRPKTVKCSLAE